MALSWPTVQQLHSNVVVDVTTAAGRVPPEKWMTPRADGKWSPAEIVEHLSLVFDVLLRELAGGGAMEVRTKLWQRILYRLTIMPKLLRGHPFPRGVRAPRETRPATANADQSAAIAAFRDRAARFETAAADAQQKPNARLTHAYFGSSTVVNGVLLCARHMQHHRKQLPD
jgi:DinB family protein